MCLNLNYDYLPLQSTNDCPIIKRFITGTVKLKTKFGKVELLWSISIIFYFYFIFLFLFFIFTYILGIFILVEKIKTLEKVIIKKYMLLLHLLGGQRVKITTLFLVTLLRN